MELTILFSALALLTLLAVTSLHLGADSRGIFDAPEQMQIRRGII